jgi:hypothetical protein
MRDGLVNHYIDASFLVASSYGPGARQSMKTVLARSRREYLFFVIGLLSGTRTHTAIQDKKDHERMVGNPQVTPQLQGQRVTMEPTSLIQRFRSRAPGQTNPSRASSIPALPLKHPMTDHPLWIDGPQAAWLAELTADTSDPAKIACVDSLTVCHNQRFGDGAPDL